MGAKSVGARVRRVEDPRLLRGAGTFVDDIVLTGTAHLTVVRTPHAHARIRSIDLTAARALPGVLDAFAAEALGPVPIPVLIPIGEFHPAPQHPLARDTARYVGEGVAVVVAESRAVAEDAAELVEVDYEVLPAVVDPLAALEPGAAVLHETAPDNVGMALEYAVGDVDAAFAAADHVVAERLTMQRYTGIPLETRGALAARDAVSGELVIWSSSQWPHTLRDLVATLLGLPPAEVRVIAPDIGGGFGTKSELYPEDVLVPLAARRLGRPVKWIEDRTEHFLTLIHSREQVHDVELALTAGGRITGLRARLVTDVGAYQRTLAGVNSEVAGTGLAGPYDIPNVRVAVVCALTTKSPVSPYRGAGAPEACFARERLLDIAARQLGLDRAELRRINLVPPELMPYDTGMAAHGSPIVLDSGDFPAALDRALDRADYAGFAERQRVALADGRLIGLGIAVYHQLTGLGPFEGAEVRVGPDGRVTVASGAAPQGQGTATMLAQIVADQLGVAPEAVGCVLGDTARIPFGGGTYASRTAVMAGTAAHLAAGEVREKALQLAAHQLEVDVSDLELVDGSVRVKGSPHAARSLAELAAAAAPGGARPPGMAPDLAAVQYFETMSTPYAFGIHVVEAAVDPATGQVEIPRYVVVSDAGVIVNPAGAEGQIVGGIAQGLGGALMEELVYDLDGQPLTTSFLDYVVPGSLDVPAVEIEHLASPSPLNPLGIKGLGEGGAIGAHAAVANAVADAIEHLGVRVTATPLKPTVVWELIASADADAHIG